MKDKIFNIENYHIGQIKEFKKYVSIEDVIKFSELSGDKNPIHIDENYASISRYKKRLVHGTLILAYFSKIYGMIFPGNGCTIAEQNIIYKKPVYINKTFRLVVEIIDIDKKKRNLIFKNICYDDEKILIEGDTRVFLP